jgi:hypothetical protein
VHEFVDIIAHLTHVARIRGAILHLRTPFEVRDFRPNQCLTRSNGLAIACQRTVKNEPCLRTEDYVDVLQKSEWLVKSRDGRCESP